MQSGIQFMPFKPNFDLEINRLVNVVGLLVYPFGLCLLLPIMIYSIVIEKEKKLIETMKINGLKMYNYWAINFAFNFGIYCITVAIYYAAGFLLDLKFFTHTDPKIMLTVFLGWGLCQNSFAFFVSVFINNSQTASLVGYALSIWVSIISNTLNITVYSYPKKQQPLTWIVPNFPFSRAVYLMAYQCSYKGKCYEEFSQLETELVQVIQAIYFDALVYLILAVYLYQVVPQSFGVAKSPCFCLKKLRRKALRRKSSASAMENYIPLTEKEIALEDDDVRESRKFVKSIKIEDYENYPLIVKEIRKVYDAYGNRPPNTANKNISLCVKKGEMFGLLGPNGAGKTTLISQMTGMFKSTSGNAWIAGYDIKSQLEQIQLQIGLCPQFDIHWPEMTVEEHLLFYARLKGIKPKYENKLVARAMREVKLEKQKEVQSRNLSLGMRRRLSIAISLVAEPKIVFLDEPTTGLDPETRREVWNILTECKKRHSIVLTTHSMEEADVLCQRIAIINLGIMRCIGP